MTKFSIINLIIFIRIW